MGSDERRTSIFTKSLGNVVTYLESARTAVEQQIGVVIGYVHTELYGVKGCHHSVKSSLDHEFYELPLEDGHTCHPSLDKAHDDRPISKKQEEYKSIEFLDETWSETVPEILEHSEGFITPESELHPGSDSESDLYKTPEPLDTAAWYSYRHVEILDRLNQERGVSNEYTPLQEQESVEGLVPPLNLSRSDGHHCDICSSGVEHQVKSCSIVHRAGSLKNHLCFSPREERVVKVKVDKVPSKVTESGNRHLERKKFSQSDLEADKEKLRKWFEKFSVTRTVKVTEQKEESGLSLCSWFNEQEEGYRQSRDTHFKVNSARRVGENTTSPDVASFNPVTYRRTLRELSFSPRVSGDEFDWESPELNSRIIFSEVQCNSPSEETELLEPIDYEIVLREPSSTLEKQNREALFFTISESVTMDTEVVNGTEDVQGIESAATNDVYAEGPETGIAQAEQLAELVLVTTSFSGMKKHFFQSKLAQHILDCKGMVYYLIDANRDFATARDLKDTVLYEQWSNEGVLKCEYIKNRKSIILPQLIIDGVSVGDAKAIQDLEDDGDLDYIVARMLCPACLSEKGQNLEHCPHCYVQYKSLIPAEYREGVDIQRFCQGVSYDPAEN